MRGLLPPGAPVVPGILTVRGLRGRHQPAPLRRCGLFSLAAAAVHRPKVAPLPGRGFRRPASAG